MAKVIIIRGQIPEPMVKKSIGCRREISADRDAWISSRSRLPPRMNSSRAESYKVSIFFVANKLSRVGIFSPKTE